MEILFLLLGNFLSEDFLSPIWGFSMGLQIFNVHHSVCTTIITNHFVSLFYFQSSCNEKIDPYSKYLFGCLYIVK